MSGTPLKIRCLLERLLELTLWMFQFPQISERQSDSHFFGRTIARGKALITR